MVLNFDKVVAIITDFALKASLIYKIYKVFLFGSYATGKATEDSDIDVCFILHSFDGTNKYQIIGDLYRLALNNWDFDIQPIAYLVSDLNNKKSFLKVILGNCIEIWPAMSAQDASQRLEAAGNQPEAHKAAS